MSESLLFTMLGFLVACLLGTVFASFLWRRAVSVTIRKFTEDENFAGLDEVAGLKADLRSAQNSLAAKDREIGEAASRAAELETFIAEAEATGEGATENLKQELQDVGAALEAAHAERDTATAALAAKDEEISAAEERAEEAQERVAELENAIRTFVKETSLFDSKASENTTLEPTTPAVAYIPSNTEENGPRPSLDESLVSSQPHKPEEVEAVSAASGTDDEEIRKPSLAISRSLEERIEALKQAENTSL